MRLRPRLRALAALTLLAACARAPLPAAATPSSPAAELVVVEQGAGRLAVLDPRDGSARGRVAVGFNPHEVALSRDGALAYVSNFGITDYDRTVGVPGTSVSIVRLADVVEVGRLELPGPKAPHGLKLRPGGDELFVNAEAGDEMLVFDAPSRRVVRRFPVPAGTHNFVFTADGAALYLMAGPAGVYRVDPADGRILGERRLGSAVRGLSWMPGERQLLAAGKGELWLLSPADLSVERRLPVPGAGQFIYAVSAPDGRRLLAPAPFDEKVWVVDLASGEVVAAVPAGHAPILMAFTPDGREAWVANAEDDHLTVIDLATLAARPAGQAGKPNGLAFRVR